MDIPDLSHLAASGTQLTIRATTKAARNRIVIDGQVLRVYVTVVPEGGKANAAITRLLSKALSVPKSRLTLLRGDTARDKVFRIEP